MEIRLNSISKDFERQLKARVNLKVNSIVAALAANTPIDTGRARAGWRFEKGKIVNDVEYISDLNNGSSKQAPAYFVESTVLSQEGVRPNGAITRLE